MVVVLAFESSAGLAVTAEDFRGSHFRGFDLGDIRLRRLDKADLDALAATGANIVRLFVRLTRCSDCESYQMSDADVASLEALLNELRARSIYAIVSLYPMGDERGPFWANPSLQASFIGHWRNLASRFREFESVAGFDLLNEPVPPGLTYGRREATWLEFARRLGEEIRKIDPSRVLIVESAPDATPPSFDNMGILPLTNVVYSVHSYLPIALTHQGVMEQYTAALSYGFAPNADVGRDELFGILKSVTDFQERSHAPILVGEFSCVRWAPAGSAARYIKDSIDYFEGAGWSWVYHEFRGWHGWDPEIASENKDARSRSEAAPVIEILKVRMKANKGPGR